MKRLRVTNILKRIKFKGAWCELDLKKSFPETIILKIFETNPSFLVKECTTGKV